uniref:G-protein coupled receptors family 1 profile domain-containing protein n=1 Tax=Hucho hucho TaxID=62062 RepID=A0A4W5KWU1_9TELE
MLGLADLLYCTLLPPASVDSYLHLRWRGSIFGLLLFLSNSVSIITPCLIEASRYLLVARREVFEWVFSGWGLALLLPSTWTWPASAGFGSFMCFFHAGVHLQFPPHQGAPLHHRAILLLLLHRPGLRGAFIPAHLQAGHGGSKGAGQLLTQLTLITKEPGGTNPIQRWRGEGEPWESPVLPLHLGPCAPIGCSYPYHCRLLLHPLFRGQCSCNNPVLYTVLNRQFGQTYRALLARATTPVKHFWNH